MESILYKNDSRKPDKKSSPRRLDFLCMETSTKNPVQEFHPWCPLFFISVSTRFIDEFNGRFQHSLQTRLTNNVPLNKVGVLASQL